MTGAGILVVPGILYKKSQHIYEGVYNNGKALLVLGSVQLVMQVFHNFANTHTHTHTPAACPPCTRVAAGRLPEGPLPRGGPPAPAGQLPAVAVPMAAQ